MPKASGVKIIPWMLNLVMIIPRLVLVAALRILLSTKFAEVGAGWHCSQALAPPYGSVKAGFSSLARRNSATAASSCPALLSARPRL